jgi:phosphoribosylanthranilate isomerase
MGRPLIKVCGVTRVADAVACAELGVDMVGLNFHPPSPRYVEVAAARRIADAVRGRVELVGVFVDREPDGVAAMAEAVGLDRLQFHGDEPAGEVGHFGDRALRVFRVDPARSFDGALLADYPRAWGFLFDLAAPDVHGGGGRSWPYERIAAVRDSRPILVAGGVTPETAADALRRSGAAGVDVCSGVEAQPGVKDPAAIERLVAVVRHPAEAEA